MVTPDQGLSSIDQGNTNITALHPEHSIIPCSSVHFRFKYPHITPNIKPHNPYVIPIIPVSPWRHPARLREVALTADSDSDSLGTSGLLATWFGVRVGVILG